MKPEFQKEPISMGTVKRREGGVVVMVGGEGGGGLLKDYGSHIPIVLQFLLFNNTAYQQILI